MKAATLLGEADFLRRLLYPYIIASQVIPKLALAPLFVLWFGFGMTSTVVITALICFFPLLENTLTALHRVPLVVQEQNSVPAAADIRCCCSRSQASSAQATDQACAGAPRGACGGAPSKISLTVPRPASIRRSRCRSRRVSLKPTRRSLARRIREREISSEEVVQATLRRIEQVNPKVNAVTRVLAPEARKAADAADRKLAEGATLGPLHGVPFTVKENIDLAGTPTTWGVKALAEAMVPVDAPVVQRMRAAGAIPIARTNLPDMALRVHTDSSLHGLTRNPWNHERTAAGSSGGEAVALATGMSPIGLGNDIGGSLRNPANACGIASIRPSAGRVPDAGLVPTEDHLLAVQLMNVQGPMARRVSDVRLGLRVLMAVPGDGGARLLEPALRRGDRAKGVSRVDGVVREGCV